MCSAGNEANFRTSAYEAITAYITHATVDVIPVVQNTVVAILHRMEQLLGMQVRDSMLLTWPISNIVTQNQILGIDDRNNWNELQSNFCSVVIVRFSYIDASIGCSSSLTERDPQTQ